jgi:hypothetical protein
MAAKHHKRNGQVIPALSAQALIACILYYQNIFNRRLKRERDIHTVGNPDLGGWG